MIIVKDIVMQKEEYEDADDYMHYDIYTREFYERFGETISVKKREYDEIEIGDEIYIEVGKIKHKLVKNNSEELLNNKILTVHEYSILEGYEPEDKELLTKEKIKETIVNKNMRAKNFVIVSILVLSIMMYSIIFKILYEININYLIILLVTVIYIILTLLYLNKSVKKLKCMKIKYIDNNDFYILKEKIIDVNKDLWLNNSTERSFIIDSTKEKVYLSNLRYINSKDGDILYMIFINNKYNSLLLYYDTNKYELDDELKQYVKESKNERN